MRQSSFDLSSLFQVATRELAANQQAINQADAYNANHGTNMVDTFQTISSALEKKKGSSTSTALNYAAKELNKSTQSGSGKLYAENLSRAASQFKGRPMDERGALDLLQTLIGGGAAATQAQPSAQPSAVTAHGDEMLGAVLGGLGSPGAATGQASGSEMLGSLLGGLAGGQAGASQPSSSGGDLLGSLLGGLAGGQPTGSQSGSSSGDMLGALLGGLTGNQVSSGQNTQPGMQGGIDMGDVINAAMAFMQAKQSGGSTPQALVQAFMAGSGMGRAPHREQSTEVVVNSFLQALARGG